LHLRTLIVPVEAGLLHYGQLFSRTAGVLFEQMISRFLRLVVRDVIRRRNSAFRSVRQWGHARPNETRRPIPNYGNATERNRGTLLLGDQRAVGGEVSWITARVAVMCPLGVGQVGNQDMLHILVCGNVIPFG
jgi:hypothetical protein